MPLSRYRKQIASRILHRLADPTVDIRTVIKPIHMSHRPLQSLLRERRFRARLRSLLNGMQLLREIELQRASVHAASLLARQVLRDGTMSEARRRTCIELIRLARSSRTAQTRGAARQLQAGSQPGSNESPLTVATINPALSHAQVRALVESLEQS